MDKNAIFEKMLLEYVEREKIFGALQIAQHGEVIYKKNFGFADLEKGLPISDETVFRFYSMSKQFTAIAIMQLCEKGLLDVYDSVCDILTDCPIDKKIKVINLLRHSSGLPEVPDTVALAEDGSAGYDKVFAWLADHKLCFEPGTTWEYINANYILLSLIIERLSGECFADYIRKNIFDTFGMKTARCDGKGAVIPGLAVGYEKTSDGELYPTERPALLDYSLGGATITGKMADADCLHKVIRERKILSDESWDMIFTKSDVSNFGFGCMILRESGIRFYQNNGGHLGFRTLHRYIPEYDFDVILLSNSGFGSARNDIGTMIFNCYLGGQNTAEKIVMDKGLT